MAKIALESWRKASILKVQFEWTDTEKRKEETNRVKRVLLEIYRVYLTIHNSAEFEAYSSQIGEKSSKQKCLEDIKYALKFS